jgi:hypothetical protein
VEKAVNDTTVLLSHTLLLGSDEFTAQMLRAVEKVNDNLPAVRKAQDRETGKARA